MNTTPQLDRRVEFTKQYPVTNGFYWFRSPQSIHQPYIAVEVIFTKYGMVAFEAGTNGFPVGAAISAADRAAGEWSYAPFAPSF